MSRWGTFEEKNVEQIILICIYFILEWFLGVANQNSAKYDHSQCNFEANTGLYIEFYVILIYFVIYIKNVCCRVFKILLIQNYRQYMDPHPSILLKLQILFSFKY